MVINGDCFLSYSILALRSQQFVQLRVTQRIATNEFTDIFTVVDDAQWSHFLRSINLQCMSFQ